MARKPELTAEEKRLKDLIRLAHEAAKELYAAVRAAHALAPTLIEQFEAHHKREMQQLSDHLTAEANRIAAQMNAHVDEAREEIRKQVSLAELVLDPDANTARLVFNGGRFDDQMPALPTYLVTQEKNK